MEPSEVIAYSAPVLAVLTFWLTHRKSGRVDMLDTLQEDNKAIREEHRHCQTRLETVTGERDALRIQVGWYIRRYGNGDTPPSTPITPS